MSSKWLTYLKSELTRRNLLRGGALLTATLVAPELAACGPTNPPSPTTGSGTTGSGSTGSTSSSSTTSATSSTSSTSSTTGTTGTSTSSSSSSSSGTTGASCSTNSNTFTVAVSQIPVGGGTVFTDNRYSDPQCGCGYNEFIVLQPSAGNFVALSTGCTHQFCSVQLASNNSILYCGCHGSEFGLDGHVIRGPAGSPLSSIPVCSDGTTVYVQLA